MYEGCYQRNLSSVENPTLEEANVIVSMQPDLCYFTHAWLVFKSVSNVTAKI